MIPMISFSTIVTINQISILSPLLTTVTTSETIRTIMHFYRFQSNNLGVGNQIFGKKINGNCTSATGLPVNCSDSLNFGCARPSKQC